MPDGGLWLISYGVDFNTDSIPIKYLDQYMRTMTVRVSEGFGYKGRGTFCTPILRNLKSRNPVRSLERDHSGRRRNKSNSLVGSFYLPH